MVSHKMNPGLGGGGVKLPLRHGKPNRNLRDARGCEGFGQNGTVWAGGTQWQALPCLRGSRTPQSTVTSQFIYTELGLWYRRD